MVNSAAPQLIIISRPSGSAMGSRRSTSACRLTRGPPSAVNRHGWVLCTEGAQTALDTTYLTISSVVMGLLMPSAHRGGPGAGRCQGPYPPGPLAATSDQEADVIPAAGSVARRPRTGAGR